MAEVDYWKTIHQYMRLVKDNRALPLNCPECEEKLYLRLGKGEQPMLNCMACDIKFYVGSDVWDQIRAVVSEWHIEE